MASTFVTGVAGGLAAARWPRPKSISRPRRCGARCLRRSRVALGLAALLLVVRHRPRHERRQGEPLRRAAGRGDPPARRLRAGRVPRAPARLAARALRSRRRRRGPGCASCSCRAGRTSARSSSAMALVLGFFFLQKDLGPALVLSCVVMALYAMARGRGGVRLRRFCHARSQASPSPTGSDIRPRSASAWRSGSIRGTTACPAATRSRMDCGRCRPDAIWGSGPGLGSPQSIPAGHTDFVLAAIGEELGFVGVAVVVALYAHPELALPPRRGACAGRLHGAARHRCGAGARRPGVRHRQRRARARAPVRSRDAVSQLRAVVDAGKLARRRRRARRGETARPGPQAPQSPAPDAGRRARRRSPWPSSRARRGCRSCRPTALPPPPASASRPTAATGSSTTRGWSPRRDRSSAARSTTATAWCWRRAGRRRSRRSTAAYGKAGLTRAQACGASDTRCYPLGGMLFSVLGDWDRQTNWAARNCLVPRARQRRSPEGLRRSPARRRRHQSHGRARTSARSSATTASCCRSCGTGSRPARPK